MGFNSVFKALTRSSWVLRQGYWVLSSGHKKYITLFKAEYLLQRLLNYFRT